MTKIELNDAEVESFKAWREHQDTFEILFRRHIFEVKKGTATLFFNDKGVLTDARVDVPVYQRKQKLSTAIQFDISKRLL